MALEIYLDESGGLGFNDSDTAYFTIAFIATNEPAIVARAIKRTKEAYNIPNKVELKGHDTSPEIKKDFLNKLSVLPIEIYAITIKKDKVADKLRKDTNILYNWLAGLILTPKILSEPNNSHISIYVDSRTIAVYSGFAFDKYIPYKISFENNRTDLDIRITHLDSRLNKFIQAADIVANSIFKQYESGITEFADIIRSKIRKDERLFF